MLRLPEGEFMGLNDSGFAITDLDYTYLEIDSSRDQFEIISINHLSPTEFCNLDYASMNTYKYIESGITEFHMIDGQSVTA